MKKIIDSHWHLYALEDGEKSLLPAMAAAKERCGLSAVNLCSIPIYLDLGPEQNILMALYKLADPTAYAFGGIVYPERPFRTPMPAGMDPLSQYEELMALGFDGIKMLETKPTEQKAYGVRVDDMAFDAFFAACEKDGTPMIWHVADPETFWDIDRIPQRFLDRGWFYGDGTYLSYEDTYGQVENVLRRHPGLMVTFAHFYFLSGHPERLEDLFARYPHVGVDITPGSEMFADFRENREYYREFFVKYASRITFGTDTSVKTDDLERFCVRSLDLQRFLRTDEEMEIITVPTRGLSLPEEVCDRILGKNFEEAAGPAPRPVDKAALKAYVKKYAHLLTHENIRAYILRETEKL